MLTNCVNTIRTKCLNSWDYSPGNMLAANGSNELIFFKRTLFPPYKVFRK